MSLENIVIAVSLLLGIVLLILIIYLISRVNDLEAKAFSHQGTAAPAEKKTENEPQKVFGGLSGRQLWDEWVSMANGGDDQYGIKGDRDRFWPCLNSMSARSSRPAWNMAPLVPMNNPPTLSRSKCCGESSSPICPPLKQVASMSLAANSARARTRNSARRWRQPSPRPLTQSQWVLMPAPLLSRAPCAMYRSTRPNPSQARN